MDNNYNPLFGNTPTVASLWENEKSKYRHWIILFYGMIIAIFLLFSVSIILAAVNLDSIKLDIYNQLQKNAGSTKYTIEDANTIVLREMIIIPTLQTALFLISIVLWTKTTLDSYKAKNFSKLSLFAIVFTEFSGFVAFINVISSLFSYQVTFASWISGFVFVNKFITIAAIYFAFKVGSIKRQFQISERIELLKNNPQFNQMFSGQPTNGNNPFFNPGPNYQKPPRNQQNGFTPQFGPGSQGQQNSAPLLPNQPLTKEQQAVMDLQSLSFEQLKDMAKKLSVSGYDLMSREELLGVLQRIARDSSN